MKHLPRFTSRQALALAVCLLLAGCGQSRSPVNDTLAGRLQRFFDGRVIQLMEHDSKKFLEPVDPAAREAEEKLLTGFVLLPAESVSYVIDPDSILEAGPSSVQVAVSLKYRYEGFPENNPFSFPIIYTLAVDPSLRILESRPDKPPIWASGPVQAHSSRHFLFLSRPGPAGAQELIVTAENAYDYLQGRLPAKQEERLLILLAANAAEFERLVGDMNSSSLGRAAQVKGSVEVEPGSLRITSRHMVVNLEQLGMDRNGPETLRHELAHLALALRTRPTTPGWLAEGAALYLAGSRPTHTWAAGLKDGSYDSLRLNALSRTSELGTHEASGSATEYAYAGAAVWCLVETHGEQRFWDLYSSFAEESSSELYEAFRQGESGLAPLRVRLTEEAVQSIVGSSLEDLDRATRNWMQTNS